MKKPNEQGAVSMDMFLFAVEKQMMKTKREIEAGCPSHTKTIYARRNRLLAVELSDLIAGRQGVLRFLDHCATVMNIKNLLMLEIFTNKKQTELRPPEEPAWMGPLQFRYVTIPLRLVSIPYLLFGSRWFSIFGLDSFHSQSEDSLVSDLFQRNPSFPLSSCPVLKIQARQFESCRSSSNTIDDSTQHHNDGGSFQPMFLAEPDV